MKRACRFIPLSKQPLVMVLCQVRFSPVRKIAEYIPTIQDEFRRHGYPIEQAGRVQQLLITPTGLQTVEQERWEYRTKDEASSILVVADSVILQTTAYSRFEKFADQLRLALGTVLRVTEHDKLGVVQRIGLRYVDLVQPAPGKDHRFYLRAGLHGLPDAVFRPSTHRLHVESVGATDVDGLQGTMLVRIVQNDNGSDLPPDLAGGAPKHQKRTKAGDLVTLIDMDHFIEGTYEPVSDWVVEKAYRLHDRLIETFHDHVVTPEAVAEWK